MLLSVRTSLFVSKLLVKIGRHSRIALRLIPNIEKRLKAREITYIIIKFFLFIIYVPSYLITQPIAYIYMEYKKINDFIDKHWIVNWSIEIIFFIPFELKFFAIYMNHHMQFPLYILFNIPPKYRKINFWSMIKFC